MITRKLPVVALILICLFAATVRAGTFTIPSWVTNSCVFIMRGEKPKGTGFLVFVKDFGTTFCYLVSAKHVVQPILMNSQTPLEVRFTLKGGKRAEVITFPTFKFQGKRWIEHSNPAVDLAIAPLPIFDRIEELEVGVHLVDSPTSEFFASPGWIKKYKVGPGDQVFTLGLVPYLYSKNQPNLVLSRFGTVSLLLQKEIILPGGKQKVYFLDCQAFGGNSGGPVFVLIERSETGALIAGWRLALLGVVTQFVPSPLRMRQLNLQETKQHKKFQLMENTGITKAVPVDYLTDVLFSDSQKRFRERIVEAQKKKAKAKSSK